MNAEEILSAAIEKKTPAERSAYLGRACGQDSALRARVERLLNAHREAGSFLDQPLFKSSPGTDPAPEKPGTVVGPYKLLQQIGEGGMGTVFMAEQTHPVRRKVALKIIKPGMVSAQSVARFEAERQALALMDHPNIARVLEAGTIGATNTAAEAPPLAGRPYFVMELVKGVPITKYCDEHHLAPKERLELFVPVCQAVQHAHQKGVIHRDLKPSNVLIAPCDGRPVPKVIDFGVAKAMGVTLTERTMFTEFGQLVGTLEYMSPEQAELNHLDVDTRSDIYSLGVLLYELLTGTTPLERKRLEGTSFPEMLRLIREEEPPKPSTRLSTTEETSGIAANRGLLLKKLSGLVRGELDWIVMRCLEKDRGRRYETANGLAMDLQRYLSDEPVLAGPPSASYRFRKFARRHKAALAIAAVILFSIVLLGGGVGWTLRDRATRQAAVEEAVGLALDDAKRFQQRENLAEALSAARRAEGLLAGGVGSEDLRRRVQRRRSDLEMAARLDDIRLESSAVKDGYFDTDRSTLGYARAFREYGIDVEALSVEEAVARIRASSVPRELAATLDVWAAQRGGSEGKDDPLWRRLLMVARAADPDPGRDRFREALSQVKRAGLVELARSGAGRDLPPQQLAVLGRWLWGLGAVQEAVDLLREAQRRYPGDFFINSELGQALGELEPAKTDEALRFHTAALAIRPQSPGVHLNLGNALGEAHAEAAAAYRAAIDLKPDYAQAHFSLGISLEAVGEEDEAILAYREAVRLDPSDPSYHVNLGNALVGKGAVGEGIESLRTAVRLEPGRGSAHWGLGFAFQGKGLVDEAIAEYRMAIGIPEAHCNLGLLLQKNKWRFAEALVELRRGHELGSKQRDWKYPSAQWVRECEHVVELEAKLPGVLAGKEKVSGDEALNLAWLCLVRKCSNVSAARLFAQGFADRPDLADDLTHGGRYNGACAAALAGTTEGEGAEGIDEDERARWRKQAIDWLRTALALWTKRLETGKPADRAEVRNKLLHWQGDPDLAGLRDTAALARLPESEQEECRRLWADVAKVLADAQAPAPAAPGNVTR